MNRIWLRQKMAARGLPADLAAELEQRLDLKPFKVTEKGTSEEKGAGIIAAIVFLILMYSTFFMYGYQVMRGVIEEKSNRIVEIIVASVRPIELMLGKIIGIGLVGLTQYLVWSLVAMNLSLPGFAGDDVAAGDLGVPRIPVSMLGYFILFFILGYFLYASVYTMIAAPFNTDQEAQQLAMIPMVMIVGGIAVYPAVMNNPTGGMALFFSLFPFTASLIMFLRTARLRAARLADPALRRHPHRDDRRARLVRRPHLPRRHPDVRQEAHDPRDHPLGAVLPRQGGPAPGQAGQLELFRGENPSFLSAPSPGGRGLGVRGAPVARSFPLC